MVFYHKRTCLRTFFLVIEGSQLHYVPQFDETNLFACVKMIKVQISCVVTVQLIYSFVFNTNRLLVYKPEDQWSCKRSPET